MSISALRSQILLRCRILTIPFATLALFGSLAEMAPCQTPPPAPPDAKTEVKDLSKSPKRVVGANIQLANPSWDEDEKKANGPAIRIHFAAPAAPAGMAEKVIPAGAIRMTPEVAGEWKWTSSQGITFSPTSGWLPPGTYNLAVGQDLLAEDCTLSDDSDFKRALHAPPVTAHFHDRNYYIDPTTPALQQLVTTVDFSQPVALEEVTRHFSVTSATDSAIFQPGSQPQVLAEPKDPRRFYLRSPLMAPGEKEDLVIFRFQAGMRAKSGGLPTKDPLETKLTAYNKFSNFYLKSVQGTLRKTAEGEPEQAFLLELSIPAQTKEIAKDIEAWKLPVEPKDKYRQPIAWTKENVTDEVLAKSDVLKLELIDGAENAPMGQIFALRTPQRQGGRIFVRLVKNTAGPGGFVTAEDFRTVANLPEIPREVGLIGNGGLLALNGERKISVHSRGVDALRYTVARVQTSQINHLVSQTSGRFDSPHFRGNFGMENLAEFENSVQPIVKQGEYARNYSAFDFAPLLLGGQQAAAAPTHGLFYLTVEAVRPRNEADGPADAHSANKEWVPLAGQEYRPTYEEESESEGEGEDGYVSSYRQGDRLREHRFILVTDLGIVMKEAADGQRAVYVQSFGNRGPVADVEISVLSVNGTVLQAAKTNAIGKVDLSSLRGLQREKRPVALLARKGTDLAFIPWARNDREVDTSRFDVGGVYFSEKTALSGSVFTERGIYRPGESIHVGGIVRQRDWGGDLTGLPVELVLVNSKEDIAGKFPMNLSAGGVFSITIPTAETAPTGPWRLQLERPGSGKPNSDGPIYLGGTHIRVEEFQPDRLKVKANFVPAESEGWRSPDDLKVAVQVDTLFGLAAANRRVASKLSITPTTPSFSQWPVWQFGITDDTRRQTQEVAVEDGKTNDNGQAVIPLGLEAHTAPMLQAALELEAFEADGGRGVRTALSTLVSRQDYLIGHKAERDLNYLDSREAISVGIVAIGSNAKPVAVADLKRVLIEKKHVSVLAKQKNGSLAYESQQREEILETVAVNLPAAEELLPLPLQKPGQFRYEFRSAAGQALCAIPFFVSGKGDVAKDLERSGELEIKFPNKKWLPGEELEFSLTTPFTGAGLITVEREKVLTEVWFKCDTKSSVQKIRLPDNLDGGAYLNVVMARSLDSPDVFINPLASGIRPIPAARGAREMTVTLDAPDRIRPGERLAIGYSALKAGQIAIWAVDEGIHLVSKYQPPDPLATLLPTAALEVTTYQLMDVLLAEFTLLRKALAIGGDGTGVPTLQLGLNPFKRRRDAPVVYFSGFVPCDANRKEVFYQVPEYFAGRLNIYAVAVAPDSIGVGKKQTIVKGDFVLTATTPLFAVPGDEFTASVTIANQLEGAASTDQIKVQAEPQGGIEIIEAAAEGQSIAVGKEVTLRYRCRAKEPLGNAELKFTASSGASRQESRSTLSVRPGMARSTKVQAGWFRNGSHDVDVQRPMFSEFSERRAIVSTTPLGLAHGLSAYLKEYPHGCTEQTTSRAFPWLVLKDDVNFGVDKAEADKAIAATMDQLSRRQGPNGGFGYWATDETEGFDYLAVYVGHFLTEAKSSGFAVPARLHQGALRRLRFMADAKLTDPVTYNGEVYYSSTRWQAEMRAAAIYLLTRNEEVTTNYALRLQDYLEAKVPKQLWHRDSTAAWLAATWRLLKKETAATPLIKAHREAIKQPPPKGWEFESYYYTSKLTREATVMTVLCRHFPEIAKTLGYDELKPITQLIEEGDFHTLSAAWSVQALKAYADLAEKSGVKAGISSVKGQDVKVLVEPAAGQLKVTVPEGMVRFFFPAESPAGLGAWYQTIETGFSSVMPDKPNFMHIDIHRELVDAADQPLAQGKLGDTIFAKLTIRNLTKTSLPNLAISELLPGSFEFAPPGEPESLRPGLGTRPGTTYIDVREDRALIYLGLAPEGTLTVKYALRPTCAGTFVIPPAYAEDMYEPKVRANSAGGKLIVLPRE